MIDNLHYVRDLGYRSREAIERGNLAHYGELMHEHWLHKKKRSSLMSNADIDRWYELARANGAIGGKVIGAGGGGFLLFYTEEKAKLRAALKTRRPDGDQARLRLRRNEDHLVPPARNSPRSVAGLHPSRLEPHDDDRRWKHAAQFRSAAGPPWKR